ncbi:MAG: ClpXP protease specificity-enhancing factor [Rhodocyclaceae bacterium]|nr:ClpXP protease specificity-enhancing factor [Rhodocyclaceae bacterium]MBX3670605.1 ClpXP protease specificity-enhancing factor [Rhodocyclaceae bacterium]
MSNNVSTKPYLLRALYEWCVDQGYTPYVAVMVDDRTGVPRQYVRDGQIILNIGPDAVEQLLIDNNAISCAARFGGVAQRLFIPVENVEAIYARETGNGMAFDVKPTAATSAARESAASEDAALQAKLVPAAAPTDSEGPPTPGGPRPRLTRIK